RVTTIGFLSWIALSSAESMEVVEELFSDRLPPPSPPSPSSEELPAPQALASSETAASKLVTPANFLLFVNTPVSLLWLAPGSLQRRSGFGSGLLGAADSRQITQRGSDSVEEDRQEHDRDTTRETLSDIDAGNRFDHDGAQARCTDHSRDDLHGQSEHDDL